jgi:tetratricopeptide (TPR) repeat protein
MTNLVRTVVALLLAAMFQGTARADDPRIPPEIERLTQKTESGQPLTASEMKQLADWAQKMAADNGVAAPELVLPDRMPGGAGPPKACPPARTLAGKVLDAKSLAASLQSLTARYGQALGPLKAKIDAAAQAAKRPHELADMGMLLAMRGSGSGGVYASLLDAARGDDATTLANLGNLLGDLDDDAAALEVLLHAHAKFPGSVLVTTNLGWVYYKAGDRKAAQPLFAAAERAQPEFPQALEGLAMVARCDGDGKAAAAFARRVEAGVSSPTMAGIIAEAEQPPGSKGGAPGKGGPPGGGDSAGGGRWSSGGGPSGGGSAARPSPLRRFPHVPRWTAPELPVGASARVFAVDNFAAGREFFELSGRKYAEVMQRAARVSRASRRVPPGGDAAVELPIEPTAARAEFQKAWRTFEARSRALSFPFKERFQSVMQEHRDRLDRMHKVEGERHVACKGVEHCDRVVDFEFCEKYRDLGGAYYADVLPLWGHYWPPLRQALEDYYNGTGAPLASMRDGAERRSLDDFRRAAVWRHYSYASTFLESWRGDTATYMETECNPPGPAPTFQLVPPEASGESPCPLGPVGVSFGAGFVSMSVNCDSAKLTASAGISVAYERNFAQHSNTYYVGAGVEAADSFGRAGAGAGVYFTEQGGSVVDFGGYADAGVTLGPLGMEAGGRISAVSGAADFGGSIAASAEGFGVSVPM